MFFACYNSVFCWNVVYETCASRHQQTPKSGTAHTNMAKRDKRSEKSWNWKGETELKLVARDRDREREGEKKNKCEDMQMATKINCHRLFGMFLCERISSHTNIQITSKICHRMSGVSLCEWCRKLFQQICFLPQPNTSRRTVNEIDNIYLF